MKVDKEAKGMSVNNGSITSTGCIRVQLTLKPNAKTLTLSNISTSMTIDFNDIYKEIIKYFYTLKWQKVSVNQKP